MAEARGADEMARRRREERGTSIAREGRGGRKEESGDDG